MKCPVCQLPEIAIEHLPICPRCGTDIFQVGIALSPEERLKYLLKQRLSLEGELAILRRTYQKEIARWRFYRNGLIFCLFAFLFYWKWTRKPMVLKTLFDQKSDSLALMCRKYDSASQNNVRVIRYPYQQGDYLGKLGRMFFNDEDAGYKIGRDNGILTRQQWTRMKPGDTLNIYIW